MDGSILKNFKSFTGCKDDDQCLYYLKRCQYDVNKAVQLFFDQPSLYTPKEKVYSKKKLKPRGGIGRIGQFEEEDNKDQEFFAGGGKDSGTSIIGPKGQQGQGGDLSSKLLGKAKDIAKGGGPQQPDKQKKVEKRSHWETLGSGSALGATKSQFQNIENPSYPQKKQKTEKKPQEEKTISVIFWKNGFQIEDGELIKYEDPKGKKILQAFDNGFVPQEISKGARSVAVQMQDKKREMYKPPPKVFKAFEGTSGYSLSVKPKQTVKNSSIFPKKYSCDLNKPHTTIVVRTHDGVRHRMKFNLDNKVKTVKDAVKMCSGVTNDFDLISTFPRKVFSDMKQTIKEAGLENCQIVQKLK